MSGDVSLSKAEPHSWQHAVGDKRPATRYVVTEIVDGKFVSLGDVESRSEPNMIKPKGLRYTTGQRGFSRSWAATCARGHNVGRFYRRRQSAVDGLVEHRGECS